jgi:uncharacterized membrane protein YwaF
MPVCEGTHINSIFFFVEYSSVWIFWVISFVEKGFRRARRALKVSLTIKILLLEGVRFVDLIASKMA